MLKQHIGQLAKALSRPCALVSQSNCPYFNLAFEDWSVSTAALPLPRCNDHAFLVQDIPEDACRDTSAAHLQE